VAADVAHALEGALDRPAEILPHWRPMHGDLVPWNLREDDRGQLWLMDWEDAGWGPPLADLMRFLVAYQSLVRSPPSQIAARVREALSAEPPETIAETAQFWVRHRNLRPARLGRDWLRQTARDVARGTRELAALRALVSAATSPGVPHDIAAGPDAPRT
jgi:thiamine kinase-like enzyme